MKTRIGIGIGYLLAAAAMPWAASAAAQKEAAAPQQTLATPAEERVTVQLGDFSQMRELRHLQGFQRSDTEKAIERLARWLQRQAERRVPAGQRLEITLRDVDLAGDYEVSGRLGQDVRVIRELYPPRIELDYRLSEADGKVLQQGQADLRDTAFLLSGVTDDEPLRHEQRLLGNWLRALFPRH